MVINAITHRDYFSTACIHVNIFSDRVEIVNPGGLIGNLTVDDLYGTSVPRNPLLFGLLQRMELVERAGSGLLRIKNALEEYKLPGPEIKANKDFFRIAFVRPDLQERTVQERIEKGIETTPQTTQKTTQKIISLIKENPNITREELAKLLNITPDGVKYHLNKLKKNRIINSLFYPQSTPHLFTGYSTLCFMT